MQSALVLLVALLVGAEAYTWPPTGWSHGMKWGMMKGWHTAPCKKGTTNCQGRVINVPWLHLCAEACAATKTCRCAVYNYKDKGRCSMKNFPCTMSPVVLFNDDNRMSVTIQVFRPGPIPRATFSGAPQPAPRPGPGPSPKPPARDGPQPIGPLYRSTMTQFSGFGYPYGGCGVPMADMKDDNGRPLPFIALNWKSASGGVGMFQNGGNCGRWVKITVGMPCGDGNAGNNLASCLANFNSGQPDSHTGTQLYGYVGDACADDSNWCNQDSYHVDMGFPNLVANGLANDWRNSRISWTFLDDTPPGWSQTRYGWRWCANSKWDWLCIIITNINNGIDRIEALTKNGWARGSQSWICGQQYNLPPSNTLVMTNGKFSVRAFDRDGVLYTTELVAPPTGSPVVTVAT